MIYTAEKQIIYSIYSAAWNKIKQVKKLIRFDDNEMTFVSARK